MDNTATISQTKNSFWLWLKKSKENKWINWKSLNAILIVLIVATGVYYFTGIVDLTVKGFGLQELKSQQALLKEENSGLQSKMMALQSYTNIKERAEKEKMIAVGDIDFIVLKDTAMARK
jgi:hypothetical protein